MDDHAQAMTLSERADALEEHMMHELEHIVTKSVLFNLADGKVTIDDGGVLMARNPGKYLIMKEDPRLPKMPAKPTLIDYFKCRFASTSHLLQSAAHARKAGQSETVIMACLLHDIAVASFIRCDHGYWGAQMIEPYVDEEVSWAVRAHQALRFFPDESVGYKYPEMYVKLFGPDYEEHERTHGEDSQRTLRYRGQRLVPQRNWRMGKLSTVGRWDLEVHEVDVEMDNDRVADVNARVRRAKWVPTQTV